MNFSNAKIHNEIAICTVSSDEIKAAIKKEFLNNRISYFEKWINPNFFQRLLKKKPTCSICVSSMQKEKANEILDSMKLDAQIERICIPVGKIYF